MSDFPVSEEYEFIEALVSDGLDTDNRPDGDQFLFVEDIKVITDANYPTVCLPLSVEVEPIVYTVAMCIDQADNAEQVPGTPGFDWPITELWWPVTDTPTAVSDEGVTMRVPRTVFQLLTGAGNPGRPGGYTLPLSLYDTAAATDATVTMDLIRADGTFADQHTMVVTDATNGKIRLPDGITVTAGDYSARFTVVFSYQTISVPTAPITVHARGL